MTCEHDARQLYLKPDAKRQTNLAISYALRGLGNWIVCCRCELTGCQAAYGPEWYTPGTVGYLGREKRIADAQEWNVKVAAG